MRNEPQKLEARDSAVPRGFTLVELMLSLAMVLILVIGINFVFRSATDAVGAGNTLNTINRDAQSSQPVLFDDLRNASKNPPCFIIASQLVTQFLNADDAKTGSDPTIIITDNSGGSTSGGSVNIGNTTVLPASSHLSPAVLNGRNHEVGLLKFFAHALYHRRSGNEGTFTGSETATDAFIEIGSGALPTNDATAFFGPSPAPNTAGSLTLSNGVNVNGVPRIGAYAADWVLTRRITLMESASPRTNPVTPANPQLITAGDYYYPIDQVAVPQGVNNGAKFGANLSPLSYGTPSFNGAAPGSDQFQSSRYDLAGASPEQFDRIIANAMLKWQSMQYNGLPKYNPASLWWNPLIYSVAFAQHGAAPPNYFPLASLSAPYTAPYISAVPAYQFPKTNPGLLLNRPQCNPTVQTPLDSAALAQMAPYFLQHCSQFVVEYAGDYLQQQNDPTNGRYGDMTGIGPDGQIDYYLDANSNKHVRWYGMPRSSTGTPHDDGFGNPVLIRGFDDTAASPDTLTATLPATTPQPMTILLNYFTDVIPLRDYYSLWFNTHPPPVAGTTGAYCPPWEVDINFDPAHDYGFGSVKFAAPASSAPNGIVFNDPNNPPRYVAAWHDDMPAMIRILIKVDDPNNKVKDGPWYEYVFRLK